MSASHGKPRTVADLMEVTGLGRDTVKSAIRTGSLPGYFVQGERSGDRGRYVIPDEAFRAFCAGTWVPQYRPIFTEEIRPKTKPVSAMDLIRERKVA